MMVLSGIISITPMNLGGHYDFIQFFGHASRWVSDVPKKCVCHVSRKLPDERVENVTKNRQKCQKKKSHQVSYGARY